VSAKAAITVHRPPEEVQRLWSTSGYRPEYIEEAEAAVTFAPAPGDRGTEIHVDLEQHSAGGRLGKLTAKLTGGQPALARAKDELRRFKQRIETGEVSRSDASPEGERAERKFKQRPAQPAREEAGVR
jgi:uncharacterized membrane protein